MCGQTDGEKSMGAGRSRYAVPWHRIPLQLGPRAVHATLHSCPHLTEHILQLIDCGNDAFTQRAAGQEAQGRAPRRCLQLHRRQAPEAQVVWRVAARQPRRLLPCLYRPLRCTNSRSATVSAQARQTEANRRAARATLCSRAARERRCSRMADLRTVSRVVRCLLLPRCVLCGVAPSTTFLYITDLAGEALTKAMPCRVLYWIFTCAGRRKLAYGLKCYRA